jgi:hypothetical protein
VEVTGSPDAPEVELRITRTGLGFEGTYALTMQNAARSTRTLEAGSCEEALEALAFALAVALEPEPDAAPSPPPVSALPRAEPPPSARENASSRLSLGMAIMGTMNQGLAPSWAPGGGVFGDVVWIREGVSPGLRVGFVGLVPATDMLAAHEVRVAFQAGLLDACPTRFVRGRASLIPCVRARAGRIQAAGAGFPTARLDSGAWVDLGGTLRGAFEIVSPFGVDVEAAAGVPLVRQGFFFGDTNVYNVGVLAAEIGVGIDAHFP